MPPPSGAADVLESRRVRRVLAVDAVATVLAGLLVFARPGVLGALTFDRPLLGPLRKDRIASRIGLAVAVFGTTKGLLYALAMARYGSDGDADTDNGRAD